MSTTAYFAATHGTGSAPPCGAARLGLVGEDGANLADLTQSAHTIGGGPRCTVRLDAAGLRPLHCVITPSADGPVVRRWATETSLNGLEFTEAALSAGDLLRIGSIDLQVVDLAIQEEEADSTRDQEIPELVSSDQAESDQAETVDFDDLKPLSEIEATPAKTAGAETAVGDEPEPAPPAPERDAEQFDDSVDPLQGSAAPAAVTDLDPAIPSRLLQPWRPAAPSPAENAGGPEECDHSLDEDPFRSITDTASFSEAAVAEVIEAYDQCPPPPVEEFEAVLDQPGFVEERPPILDEQDAAAPESAPCDDPWRVEENAAEVEAEPIAEFDVAAAEAFGADPSANETPAVEASLVSSAINVALEQLRDRVRTRGARVSRLVASLRQERRQTAELSDVVGDLTDKLEQALNAADEAGGELARLAEELTSANSDRAAALVAVEELTQRAGRLEERIAELEASLAAASAPAVEPTAWDAPADEAETPAASAVKTPSEEPAQSAWMDAVAEPIAEEPEQPEQAAAESVWPTPEPEAAADESESAWGLPEATFSEPEDAAPAFGAENAQAWSAADEVEPEADSAAADDPFAWGKPPAAEAEASDEPLWGIERLAAGEESAATETPWSGFAAETPATEAPAAEPAEASDEELASDALDFSTTPPAILDEPPAVIDDPEEEGVEESVEVAEETAPTPEPEPARSYIDDVMVPAPQEERQAVEPDPAPADEPEPASEQEPVAAAAPTSFIERFAHLIPDDDEPIEAPVAPPVAIEPEPVPAIASDDDESIDDYMKKLMQRVRGSSEAAPAPAPTVASVVATPASEPSAEAAPPEAADQEAAKYELLRDITEMRRARAPEVKTDMGALRQLANQSARHALDVAQSRESREKATMKLTVSVISVVVGALASVMAASPFDVQFGGGLTSVVVGGWFGVRTLRACQTRSLDEQIAAASKGKG